MMKWTTWMPLYGALAAGSSLAAATAPYENQTILRERANVIETVWYDVRLPMDGRMAAINPPWTEPTIELSYRNWHPIWDGYSIFQNRPGAPINISRPPALLAKRDEATLFYSQGLGTRNGLALEIQQTGAIEHFQDVYTWGDLKVGASWSFLRSRYGSASLFGGCMVPTGNEYDWFESHGGFTPYLGLRFSRAFWFFAVNASSEAQLTVGPGENQVKGADPEKVENHYFSSRTSADITYRVCRFFRLGVEQKINYHRWTADGPNLVQQTVSDTPTSLVTDWTILPSARIHLFYGYDFISNREGFDANDTRTFGGGFSCAF